MSILEAPVSVLQIAADERSSAVSLEASGVASIEVSLAALDAVARECAVGMQSGAAAATDDALLDYQRRLAASARQLELAAAAAAAEISHRSRRELGYSGLAQRRGARTPEALVQRLTGMSGQASRRLVRVGAMVAELIGSGDGTGDLGIAKEPTTPAWLAPAIRAVADGIISSEVVDAIRAGLGDPSDSVSTDALAEAAETLIAESASLTLELLASRARELRDELDAAGVASREQERRDRRYLRLFPQADGMTRIVGLLDPESAAIVSGAVDVATSPRRGGPRFVSAEDRDREERIVADPRTTEQLALDALVEMVDAAARGIGTERVPRRRVDVRMVVTKEDLDRRNGVGFIDGQTATVSVATVERHACDGGVVPIMFDRSGKALNLGRTQRLHSPRQRTVIAARDGGCLAPGCERPPSWCEVHHIHEFAKGGETSVDDGVLLCRHHHMLMHNNGWRIDRRADGYSLIPPPEIDRRQTPIPLRTKSGAMRRLIGSVRS